MSLLVSSTTLARKLRLHYRPGDRGVRNPITPAQIALAVEYRSLGLSWACCGTLLRLSHNRLRVAVGERGDRGCTRQETALGVKP